MKEDTTFTTNAIISEGGNRLWCIEIQKYYIFFYEVRNGRRLMGKNKIKEILDILL